MERDEIRLALHWQGGDHTELTVRKNRTGLHRWGAAPDIEDLICSLARQLPDRAIASLLNRLGKTTGRQNGWTQSRVCTFRNHRGIAVYQEGERAARGEYTLQETAQRLGMRPMTVLRMIRAGHLPATQFCKGTPWVIRQRDLERPDVQRCAKFAMQRPISTVPGQLALAFSIT